MGRKDVGTSGCLWKRNNLIAFGKRVYPHPNVIPAMVKHAISFNLDRNRFFFNGFRVNNPGVKQSHICY